MSDENTGRELTAEFHRLLEHEPPFRTDLDAALRAAERGGRRRRVRTLAVRGGAGVLAVAASAVLVLAWPQSDRALHNPPAVVVPTEVTPSPEPVETVDPMDQLELLAREIVRPSGGSVKASRDEATMQVSLSVKADGGSFELSTSLDSDAEGVQRAKDSCRLEGSRCTTVWSRSALGVWSFTYSTQPGRQSLWLVAKAPDGQSLQVTFNNYVEMANGSKRVGPGWKDAGITASGLRQAVADSGLADS